MNYSNIQIDFIERTKDNLEYVKDKGVEEKNLKLSNILIKHNTIIMKNFNFIKRLWVDSHEKHLPQRFGHYAAMLFLFLTLGVGQMWATDWSIAGIGGDWSTNTYKRTGTGTISIVLSAGTHEFKIVKDGSTWYGNNGTMTRTNSSGWAFSTDGGNCKITADKAGTYVFNITNGTPTLSVTYPDPIYYVAGGMNSWSTSANPFVNGKVSFDLTTGTTTEFKIFKDVGNTYYGNAGTMTRANSTNWDFNSNDNAKITADLTGTYVFELVNTTPRITVHYPVAISYNKGANGTGSISGGVKTYGVDFTLSSSTFTRDGYTQDGWATSDGGTKAYNLGGTYSTHTAQTFYPHWVANSYTVTLTTNSGTINSGNVTSYTYGVGATLPTNVTRTGYKFGGWYENSDFTGSAVTSISATATGNKTYYAKWLQTTITGTMSPNPATANTTTLFTFNAIISNWVSGQRFIIINPEGGYLYGPVNITTDNIEWTSGALSYNAGSKTFKLRVCSASSTDPVIDDYVINLTVSAATYSVSVGVSPSGYGTVSPSSASATPDSWSSNISASPNAGYQFVNWTASGGGITINGATANPTQIKATGTGGTLTANFSAATYHVMLDNQSATSAGTPYVDATYKSTTLSTITTPTKTNYTFGGYYTETDGGGTQIIDANGNWLASKEGYTDGSNKSLVTEPKTLYAKWTETKYNVTVRVSNPTAAKGTIDCTAAGWVASNNGTAQIGASEVTITAGAANSGYTWGSWVLTGGVTLKAGQDLNNASIIVTATAAGTATYTYAEDLTTTWYINGDAGGTSPFEGWGTSGTPMLKKTGHSTEEIYYCTIHVGTTATGDGFSFKAYNSAGADDAHRYYAYSDREFTKAQDSCTLYTNNNANNMKFKPYITGDYEFKLDNTGANPILTVTWPTINQLQIYGATPAHDAMVSNWAWDSQSGTTYTKTLSLNAKTTYRFKVVYDSDFYGNGGTIKRNATSLTLSDSGGDTYITTDAAGSYVITFNSSSKLLSVTYPTAYTITFGAGTINGSNSAISVTASPTFSSGDYVLKTTAVTFNKGTTKAGYNWKGWYPNAAGTGTAWSTADANYTSDANTRTSNISVYACYTYQTYSITYKDQGNVAFTGTHATGYPTSHTYNSATALKTATKTGYTFGGWFTNQECTGTAVTSLSATGYTANITLYAKWTPIEYDITYELNGGNNTGIVPWNPATYSIEQNVNITVSPNKTGYDFVGWYSDSGLTTPITTPAISIGTTGNKTFYAKWTPKTYTVTFNATTNGGTCGTASKSVTFDAAYGALPVATKAAKEFVGWYTTANDDSETGTRVTAETIVSTAGAHTLYARFEDTYEVTVTYKCGEVTLYPSTKVTASASSLTPEITAPEILGYTFSNWTGTNVTPAEASSATTTITATASTTITANYTAVPTVYFKNNLDWDNVYVTFDCYFDGSAGNAPGNYGKPYYQMTQLGSSDIFYCPIPAECVSSWKWNIAFDNTGFASSDNIGTKTGAFNTGEFLGRGDFDPDLTMYIPYNGDTETRNSGTYYRTGCWMKYNSTDPGYKIYANTHVSGSGGAAVAGTPVLLTADVAGGYEFKATVNFTTANYSYGFMLHKEANTNTNDRWYTNNGAIYATTTTLPWDFSAEGASENGQRCEIHTEAIGEYEFTVSFGTGRPVVNVEYPVGVGDWKLIYKDRAAWSGAVHTAAWQHPSRVIKAKASTEDIVSFFVSKATGANATIELYKCTAINSTTGEETWTKQSDVNLSGITETGIYNFKVTQDADKNATVTFDGGYTGNFYIRTDASDGGWSNYKTSGTNTMTYSEYAESQTADKRFSHYFMRYVNNGQNIKFCIANDYSECISDTLVSDTYTNEWLEANANIRFMWYHATNKISRAYLAGSSNVADRFLVLEGDEKLYDADGNSLTGTHQISGLNEHEMKFTDDQNWVYEATVKAKPTAPIKLTAKFNDKVQYFYGTESTTYQLIGGTGDTQYKIRVVYDFKTNRLVAAWLPDGTSVSDPFPINADIMIIRSHQGDAQQITFSDNGKLTDVKTVYGAMRFNKYRLNNQSEAAGHSSLGLSQYERDLYFISFPFEVKLNEVFGFGTYGKHWIIEYYDGKGRAQNGFWADSPTNWKFVTPQMKNTFTLEANQGYVLALDLEELTMSSSVWNYGVDSVYLYFPSSATVGAIQATTANVTIDQTGYQCTINRPYGSDGDRRVKDSYWHLLGVPSFANASHETGTSWTGSVPTTATPETWTADVPYIYNWDPSSNTLSVQTTSPMTFKAMYSYLAQYSATTINWTSVNAKPASVAARRLDGYKSVYELRLDLQQNGKEVDHTFVSLRDDEAVSANFDFNFDLSKMLYGAFSSKSNIYTLTGDAIEVAGNCLPLTEQTTIVPVGVTIGANGEYTFSLPDVSDDMSVTLIDNEFGTRTDLRLMDYDVNLTAGTYSDRFMLELRTARGAATDIEGIEGGTIKDGKAHKFVRDGILYILRDGVIYDAMGKRVK